MADPFAPPPPPAVERDRARLCRAYAPDGQRCDLYWDHKSGIHRNTRTHAAWKDEDTWLEPAP